MSDKEKPSTSKCKEVEKTSNAEIPLNLNILSEDFDPYAALYSDNIKNTMTGFKSYSNISQFEAALKRIGIQQVGKKNPKKDEFDKKRDLSKAQTDVDSNSAILPERRFKEHQMPVQGRAPKSRHSRNLLKKMEEFKEGPLSVLYNLWKSEEKIIIYVRKQHGVRGYIFGHLVAFDKHTNLLLKNAYEIWKRRKFKFSPNDANLGTSTNCSQRLKKLGIILPDNELKSVDRKYVIVRRKINQIVIRGEQVCIARPMNRNDEEKYNKFIL